MLVTKAAIARKGFALGAVNPKSERLIKRYVRALRRHDQQVRASQRDTQRYRRGKTGKS